MSLLVRRWPHRRRRRRACPRSRRWRARWRRTPASPSRAAPCSGARAPRWPARRSGPSGGGPFSFSMRRMAAAVSRSSRGTGADDVGADDGRGRLSQAGRPSRSGRIRSPYRPACRGRSPRSSRTAWNGRSRWRPGRQAAPNAGYAPPAPGASSCRSRSDRPCLAQLLEAAGLPIGPSAPDNIGQPEATHIPAVPEARSPSPKEHAREG